MHPASVSARIREDVSHKLKHAMTLDSMVDSRLRYNAAELRGILKHIATQTDFCVSTPPKIDEGLQVEDSLTNSQNLERELFALRASWESERVRYQQRERLLIAQMNAMRDLDVENQNEPHVRASLSCRSIEFDLNTLPSRYDRVAWTVASHDFTKDDKVIGIVESNNVLRRGSSVEVTSEQIDLHFPRNTGQVSLHFRFLARSSDPSPGNFPLIIGEWMSPLFIPCLKDKETIETLQLNIEEVGVASFELVFS
jgi:hypothetical protein